MRAGGVVSVFGKLVRDRRKALGLTQLQLADKLNLSDKAVSHWERSGREPSIEVMHQVARLLRTTVAYLTGESDDPEATPLLDEAEAAFANKLRELNDEDRQYVERFIEIMLDKQEREKRQGGRD